MLPRTVTVSPLARRLVARIVLAGGAAAIAAMMMRDCEQSDTGLTVIVDPRPVGDRVTSLWIDVAEGERTLGTASRTFSPGEERRPVEVTVPAPKGAAELRVELRTTDGIRRVRRTVSAPAGSRVSLSIDGLEPVDAGDAATP